MQVAYGIAGNQDAVVRELAVESAPAFGELACCEVGFAESVSPVGCKHAMRGTGHGVFVNPAVRREKATYEIYIRSGSGHDESSQIELLEQFEVGGQFDDVRFVGEDRQVIHPSETCLRHDTERLDQEIGGLATF